jgi:hypothetical protein
MLPYSSTKRIIADHPPGRLFPNWGNAVRGMPNKNVIHIFKQSIYIFQRGYTFG